MPTSLRSIRNRPVRSASLRAVAGVAAALAILLAPAPAARASWFQTIKELSRTGPKEFIQSRVSGFVESSGMNLLSSAAGDRFTQSVEDVRDAGGFLSRTLNRGMDTINGMISGEISPEEGARFLETVRDDVVDTARRTLERGAAPIIRPYTELRKRIQGVADDIRFVTVEAPEMVGAYAADAREVVAQRVGAARDSFADFAALDDRSAIYIDPDERLYFENETLFFDGAPLPDTMDAQIVAHIAEQLGLEIEEIVYENPWDDPYVLEKYEIYEDEGWGREYQGGEWELITDQYEELGGSAGPEIIGDLAAPSGGGGSGGGDDFDLSKAIDGFLDEALDNQRDVERRSAASQPTYRAGSVARAAAPALDSLQQRRREQLRRAEEALTSAVEQFQEQQAACSETVVTPRCCALARQELAEFERWEEQAAGAIRARKTPGGALSPQEQQIFQDSERVKAGYRAYLARC